jgi:hypothetical protein
MSSQTSERPSSAEAPEPAQAGSAEGHRPGHEYNWVFWTAGAAGVAAIIHGIAGLLQDPVHTSPLATARRYAILLLVNDLVFLPAIFLVGLLVARTVPAVWRPPVRFALVTCGFVVLIAIFCLYGQHRIPVVQPGNHDYLTINFYASIAWLCSPLVAVSLAWGLLRQRQARLLGADPHDG